MAYIAPNSIVQFYGDMGLNDNYDDSLYFPSTGAKDTYFGITDYIIATAQAMTYTREQRGFIRVELPMSTLIRASYMRFKNTSFENKWFYAFVKNVEYINNNCTQVNFELDPLMTWMGEFTLNECFIVRCHSTTDTLGENVYPEPVSVGEYTYNDYQDLVASSTNECAVIVAIANADLYETGVMQGNYYDGVYSGLTLYAFQRYDVAGIASLLNTYSASPDSVVAMYLVPIAAIRDEIPVSGGVKLSPSSSGVTVRRTIETLSGTETINGYRPRNKKLYTYPYNFECVDNGMGDSLTLRFEYGGFEANVELAYNVMSPVEVTLRPFAYKGSGVNTINTEVLSISGYPVCAWVSDAYKAWFAQNAFPAALSIGGEAATVVASFAGALMTGGEVGGASAVRAGIGVLDRVLNWVGEDYKASIAADFTKGNKASGSNNYSSGHLHFSYGRVSVNYQKAREIDKFFDMFGYAQNQYGVPNMNARPYWSYIKTVGCSVGGSIPADDASYIEDIFNHGIRFWKGHGHIGNYSGLDNSPV